MYSIIYHMYMVCVWCILYYDFLEERHMSWTLFQILQQCPRTRNKAQKGRARLYPIILARGIALHRQWSRRWGHQGLWFPSVCGIDQHGIPRLASRGPTQGPSLKFSQ